MATTEPTLTTNSAPVVTGPGTNTTSTASVNIYEGTTAVHTYTANETVTWSITGGADQALFTINPTTGALVFNTAPLFGQNNTYVVTVTATDENGATTTQTLTVTILNDLDPTASSLSNVVLCEGNSTNAIPFTIGDDLTPVANLIVATTSNNQTLLPNSNIVLGGTGANRSIVATPVSGQYGTATVTVTVTDGYGNVTTTTFDVLVSQDTVEASVGTTNMYINGPSVTIDNSLTINGTNNVTNAQVLISSGFVSGDVLEHTDTLPNGVTKNYNATTGVMTFTGSISSTDLQTIFRNVKIKTTANNTQDRVVTFLAGNALPFASNGHYYEFKVSSGISWNDAKIAAEGLTFNGLQGYLATITSAEENAFVASKLAGQGWFGASDAAVENEWRWMTGPEAGTQFWQGLSNGSVVGGLYNNWNSGEPNNSGNNEDYAHFLTSGKWNDYPLSVGSIQGYVVEYGGMANDPCISISDTKTVNVFNYPVITGPNNSTTSTASLSMDEGLLPVFDYAADTIVTWTITGGADQTLFTIDTTTGELSFITAPQYLSPADSDVNNTYIVQVTATDAQGGTTTQTLTVSILCVGPEMTAGPSSSSTYDSLTPEEFYYVNWNNYSNGLLTGTVNVGGTIVNVSVTNSSNSIIQYGDAPFCGTSHWAPAPSGNGGSGSFRSYTLGQHRFMFDQPVSNPRFFISSLNKVLNLSAPGKILASNGDFVGAPDGTVTTVLNGDEACGTVSFAGDFTEVSFTGLETEFYCDFSMGIAGLSIPCVNSVLPTIIHETTNATGIGTPSGLPAGVTATWANNTITISGTPTQSGTFNYDIPLTGGCGTVSATGTITVLAYPNISYPQTDYTLYSGNAISSISPSNTGGTITSWSISPALPAGLTLNTSSGVISGTPTDGFNETTFIITASNGHCEDTTSLTLNALTCYGFNADDMILRGNASISGSDITLTPASNTQFGAVWSTDRLDLSKDFRVKSQLYFGNNNAGADGLAFVLQPLSSNQGSSGGGLGYAGINPSFSVEFDTYYNGAHELSNDHMAIIKNGLAAGNHSEFASMIDLGNIEDNNWHDFEVSWIAATKNFKVYYDGVLRYDLTVDIANTIFNGNENTYFGFTAATGGAVNTHAVRILESCLTRVLNLPPTVTTVNDFDSCFNQTTQAVTITVADDTTPVADIVVTATSSNTSLVPNNQISISASGATRSVTLTPVSGQFGSTTITLTIADQEGATVTETFNVTIDDTVNPTVVTQNITVQLDANGQATITPAQIDNGSTDNCDIDTITLDTTSFNCSNVGNNTVTLTVTDVKGNSSSNTAVVTVEDNINPTVLFTQNITIQLNASGTASISTSDIDNGSFDNCGIASMTLDYTQFTCANVGTNPVVLTVTDVNGNVSTASATVTIVDIINPVALAQNVTLTLGANGQLVITPSTVNNGSYDNCSFTMAVSPNTFGPSNIGDNTVVLVVTDASGNTHFTTATVTIIDTTSPVVTTQNVTISLGTNGQAIVTANQINNGSTDNTQIASMSVSPNNFTCANLGDNTVTLTVTDIYGNVGTNTAVVTVTDTTLPTIVAPIAINTTTNTGCTVTGLALGTPVTSDNCTVASVTNNAPVVFPLGTTIVTWTIVDGSGNTVTATQNVTVTDIITPTITAPAALTISTNNGCFAVNTNLGTPVTSDNCSVASVTNNAPSSFPLGNTTVTWTVVDGSGNTSTATQVVTVVDSSLPTIVAPIAINTTTNTGCTATGVVLGNPVTNDNCSIASVTNNAPVAFPLGNTTVTWTVVDGSGNIATATQLVTVTDVTLPTVLTQAITVALDTNGQVSITVADVDNGSFDNCAVGTMSVSPSSFTCANVGENTVTLTVTDVNGNVATNTALVTVVDLINPTVITQNITITLDDYGDASITADMIDNGSFDNCGVANVTVNVIDFNCDDLGANTVILTVTDVNGNVSTGTATVTVISTAGDNDNDGMNDNCDDDDDNDGIIDEDDNCQFEYNPNQADNDDDGLGDVCDEDDDNDGVFDVFDNCPFVYNPEQEDRDNDGIGDVCDTIEINISDAITPNGDGINDTWMIYNIENHPKNNVRVYSRWGDLVFEARNYQNEWDGHYKNRTQSLPDGGSYYYQVDLDGNGTVDYDGWLYISRK